MTSITGYRRPYFATQPAYLYPGYRSTLKRAPTQPLVFLPHTLSEVTGPVFGYDDVKPTDSDLTRQHDGEPLGERIVVSAPLDPNFTGVGRVLTDGEGRYRFVTIKPGAYPWRNHYNAWRPAHLHFSLFGLGLVQRLVTQMYFPGDPLLEYDPMYNSVPDDKARPRMISSFDWETTIPDIALAYRYDIVLRGRDATPMETSRS
ncbi:MAG: protocatechuate 3,4-dioxygenase subunit beta [Betaproteobacteria bacterium]|nr:MAG: protocatechuate 3,4-dioxygenase subunit beta [Betaproteobacteria bacterium]